MRSLRTKLNYALLIACVGIVLASGIDTRSKWGPGVIVPQVRDSFFSGGNVAYTFGNYLFRKFHSGPRDPRFDQSAFIAQHKVPYEQWEQFMGTHNELEARWLLADLEDTEHRRQLLQARGEYSSILAWWISSGLAPLGVLLTLLAIRRYTNSNFTTGEIA